MPEYFEKIKNKYPGAEIFSYAETDSTNNRAKEYAKNAENPAVPAIFTAESQSAGRGRGDHSFHSPGGGIYMSILTKPELAGEDIFLLTPAAAVAAAEAIETETGIKTDVKWVNDLFSRGKKVCGILAESVVSRGTYIVLGVGINVFAPDGGFPPELTQAGALYPTRECAEAGIREKIMYSAAQRYLEITAELENDRENAKQRLYESYRARLNCIGKTVTVIRGNDSYTATVRDIDENFALFLESERGNERLTSGEISIKL